VNNYFQEDDMSEEALIRMMSGLAGGGGGGGLDGAMGGGGEEGGEDGEFMPMMQDMMKNLLSRDVLYPSLKEISAQVCLFCNLKSECSQSFVPVLGRCCTVNSN